MSTWRMLSCWSWATEEAEPQRKFSDAENSTQTCWFTFAYENSNMGWRLRNAEMICSKEMDPGSLFGLAARLLAQHQSYLLKDEGLSSQLSAVLRLSQVHIVRWNLPQGTEGAGKSSWQTTFHHLSTVLVNWKVADDWRPVSATPIYKNDHKENLGNDSSASLTLVLGKDTEQIILPKKASKHSGLYQ